MGYDGRYEGFVLVAVLFAVSFVGAVCGAAVGRKLTETGIRSEAVKVGAAHYVANEDGTVRFEWIVREDNDTEK